VQGASTITQQMVKGLLLTPERTYVRKIREAILARRIEERFSKEEILYLYLNQIYFGQGAYGIGEAARTYYDKPVEALDVSEAALLAGLPKAPSRYSPVAHPVAAEQRRLYVLERMLADGIIDADRYAFAVASPPLLVEPRDFADAGTASYFTEEVRRRLFEELGGELVLRGGLVIETTLDAELQAAAVESMRTGLEDLDHRQGYRGPLRQVTPEQFADELARLSEKNDLLPEANGEPGPDDDLIEANAEEVAESPPAVELLPDIVYEGLVTAVDTKANTARVEFAPDVAAITFHEDLRWARAANPEQAPYKIREIATALKEGDVTLFRLHAAPDDADAKLPEGVQRVDLVQYPIVQGALYSVEVATGDVLAMVGGYDFGESQFNRVTQARRQPGSAFKPLIYSAALMDGYTPASILYDRPIVYTDEESGFVWRPRNYKGSFYGPITMREALVRSVNNATVHLFRDVGVGRVIEYARMVGIESPLNRDLSLALGSSDLSLSELTRAYAVYASGGRRVTPIFIRSVRDRNGDVLLENVPLGGFREGDANGDGKGAAEIDVAAAGDTDAIEEDEALETEAEQIIPPELAYLTTAMLKAVVFDPDGTGWRLKDLRRPVAGKTGTTNDQADAWFMGYSPDVVTGVWVGHDVSRFLGWGETGSRAAAPIWVGYMREALRERPVRDFPVPDPIVFARIDRETGLLAGPSSKGVVFEAFLPGTEPTERAEAARTTAEGRRLLRIDDF
jgi:penicillin-binding protein 1A